LEIFGIKFVGLSAESGRKLLLTLAFVAAVIILRFVAREHGGRELKDAMSRDILAALEEAGIGIATTTFGIVELPPLRLENGSAVKVEQWAQQGKG
jgi:hypothetical protein